MCILTCNGKYADNQGWLEELASLSFTLFQLAFSPAIGFSASSEGFILEMKPIALAMENTVSLKA